MTVCDGIRRIGAVGTVDDRPGAGRRRIPRGRGPLWPTFHRFAAGHSVGIQVSSGAHPRYARNPGIGRGRRSTRPRRQSREQEISHDGAARLADRAAGVGPMTGARFPASSTPSTSRSMLGALEDHGETRAGHRRVVPIIGGSVTRSCSTPRSSPGGADWQIVRPDGTIEVDARYTARTRRGRAHPDPRDRRPQRPARGARGAAARRAGRPVGVLLPHGGDARGGGRRARRPAARDLRRVGGARRRSGHLLGVPRHVVARHVSALSQLHLFVV